MVKAVLSMCLAIAILGGSASLVFAYTCPGASTCAGKTCPSGNPICKLSAPSQCNCFSK